jgi:regulatory protein YycI of two-component signal transduction system YycFG
MKNKGLLLLILVLLVSNVFLLYNYLQHQSKRNKKVNAMEKFQKEVGFTKEQMNLYSDLRKKQKEELDSTMELIRIQKKEYVNAIFQNKPMDSLKRNYALPLAENMLTLDQKMYAQFMEARKICTPNQYLAYDSLIKHMMLRVPNKKHNNKK